MIRLGLTGRMGAGKSTVLTRFVRHEGIAGYDCDAAVHDLYRPGGAGTRRVETLFPDVLDVRGGVDRERLGAIVFSDPRARHRLEAVIHPLVERAYKEFFFLSRRSLVSLAVVEHSLLFETSGASEFDAIAAVVAPESLRRRRAFARPGMTEEIYAAVNEAQRVDAHVLADFVIDTGGDIADTLSQVESIVRILC